MAEEFDVVVIGSGPGGYVAAIRAAQLGFKTACVEKSPVLGGTCLNVGCIPSKALLHSSELYYKLKTEGEELGVTASSMQADLVTMMRRKEKIVTSFNQGIEMLFKKNKIKSFYGHGKLLSNQEVSIASQDGSQTVIKAKHILLATGSEPMALPFLKIDETQVVTSTGALALKKVPKKMVVIGAGVIGVELGSVYSRLGAEVLFVEFLDRVCPGLDASISKELKASLEKQGMRFLLSSKVVAGEKTNKGVTLKIETQGKQEEIVADVVLVSIGRKPYTEGLGLKEVGIQQTDKGFIIVDGNFRTTAPNVYAIGDIIDGPMLAHKASEEGVCAVERMAGHNVCLEYITIPNVVYTYPEVATVGLSDEEAKKLGFEVRIGRFPFRINSRAKCTGETEGEVKIVADQKTNVLLGMHIIGAHASEMISLGSLALKKKVKVEELMQLTFAHPTLSEAIKEACLDVFKQTIHM